MVQIQIQLSESQLQALRQLSAACGESISELIRRGIQLYLDTQPLISREERVKHAMRWVGKFSSGKNDIGIHHDRYLADAYRK